LIAPISAIHGNSSEPLVSPTFAVSNQKFCLDGVIHEPLRWQLGEEGKRVTIWGSYCPDQVNSGQIESAAFLAPAVLSFYVSGDLGRPGLRLALRNVDSGEELEMRPPDVPGARWEYYQFSVPSEWVDKRVEIIGEQTDVVGSWFAFTAPLLPSSSLAPGVIDTSREQSGFCQSATFGGTLWFHVPAGSITPWGSYCDRGDDNVGWLASKEVTVGTSFPLYVAGYPGTTGIRLALENVETGQQLPLQFVSAPRESWRLYYFPLPKAWKNKRVRVLAEDAAARPAGWVSLAVPPPRTPAGELGFALRLLAMASFLLFVIMAPAAAACMLAFRKGMRDPGELTAIAILAIGLVSYLAFWTYLFSPKLGATYSYVVLCASCVIVWMGFRRQKQTAWPVLRQAAVPWLLVALASIFIICLGFIYGRPDSVQDYAAHRFGPPDLSIDNFVPKIFADDVVHGHVPVPMVGDWLSSDRPPLQTGTALYTYAFTHGKRDVEYQVVAVILQLTFLAGIWTYVRAAGVNHKALVLMVAATLFSGFTIMNAFFTWPKLLPVSFLLLLPAYLFTKQFARVRASGCTGAMVGAAAALAMLCHGGSAFALIGVGATLAVMGRIPRLRFTIAAILTAACIYSPWILYQKYYDPPGDRLLKFHLAGVTDPHPELKLGRLLAQKYGELTMEQVALNKLANFEVLFRAPIPWWKHSMALLTGLVTGDSAKRSAAVASIRFTVFLHWFWSIDLSVISLPALLWCLLFNRRQTPELDQAWRLWVCTALTLVAWCLIMFAPGSTSPYQGSYFTEIAAILGSTLALWALSPLAATIVVAIQVLANACVEVLSTAPRPLGVATFMGPVNVPLAVAAVTAVLAIAWVLWRIGKEISESGSDAERPDIRPQPDYGASTALPTRS
jgi:hypothetical protein